MVTNGVTTGAVNVGAGLPKKMCDLVMKGGVTSGVVYPKAITELSKEYQFASIGGTSAGAIAASVAAAAEYARAGGKLNAFEELNDLPDSLGKKVTDGNSMLFHLFQPQHALRGVFGVAMAWVGKSGVARLVAIFWAALKSSPLAAVLGAALGILVVWVAGSAADGLRGLGIALGIVIAVVGLLLGLAVGIGVEARRIPKYGWGICSGMTEGLRAKSPALAPWLAGYLDKMAGKRVGEPLTFGDLQQRGIALQIITTNLTTGRPYTMPFDEHTHFYFKGAELRKFFPEYVVSWMESHPGTRSSRDAKRGEVASDRLSVLPDAENLPVIVAVRMSLSFPFLFCPVPFYGVDFGSGPKDVPGKHVPEPTLFVDGGMTSNFPLNLFDKPLPRWPTFGINLRDKNTRHPLDVYMACTNDGGLEQWWTRFDTARGLGGLVLYFSLLFDTSRNWRDNLQINVPGYRDRVVHIGLTAQEGGMNLDMEKGVIDEIAKRGGAAGRAVLARYSPTAENPRPEKCVVDLENQKWVRFRSFMELLEEALLSMEKAENYSGSGERTYPELLRDSAGLSYWMSGPQRAYAEGLLRRLIEMVATVKEARAAENSFETRVPKPEPDLKVTPHF